MDMGNLTKKDESIIRKIVAIDKFEDTSLATLIDEYTSTIAMEWANDYSNFRFIFRSLDVLNEDERIKKSDAHFKEIEELIILLRYLEDERLIYLFENKDAIKDNHLYNKKKYNRKDDGTYCNDEGKLIINGRIYQADGYFYQDITNMPYDIGKYVHHFAKSIFGISGSLRELVEDDFKTPEQIRHEQAMGKARKQVKYSRWTFWGSIVALIISSVLGIWTKCSDTTINRIQLDQIKQTIEKKTLPEVFKAKIINDTLTTKVVEMPKTQQTP